MASGSSMRNPLPHSITPNSTLLDPDWTTGETENNAEEMITPDLICILRYLSIVSTSWF